MRSSVLVGMRWLCLALAVAPLAGGQEIQLGLGENTARRQHVELETDTVRVKAGVADWVELRFRVDQGFHINSHVPKDELLMPTAFQVNNTGQIKVSAQEYPPGVPLRLDVGAGETLSTYQGEFRVRLQLRAAKGDAALEGTLKYQACDARSCFPPKSLPVHVTVSAQ